MRDTAERVARILPDFHVAFTGQPAIVVEEMDTVRRDTWLTSIIAVLGVSALTFLVFRWRSHAVLVLLCLATGIAWAFGAVALELGYLNLITSSFVSTLVGIGVAYGIHPVSEYELRGGHTGDPVATLREAFHRTGAGVTVAALTTAAAFFSIQLMSFRGFAELGLVAGVGVLLCLAAAMISLPACLVVYSRWRRRRDRSDRSAAAVDRFWVERAATRVCRFPKTTVLVAFALTAAAGWAIPSLEFDTNIIDLLPRNAESVEYQRRMVMDSDLSPLFTIVVAEDLEQLHRMRERAMSEPSIERFESVLRFLPRHPDRSRAAIARLRPFTEEIVLPEEPRWLAREELGEALRLLERTLGDAGEMAFGAGLGEVAGALEDARAEAERCVEASVSAPAGSEDEWNRQQARLLDWTRSALHWLKRAMRTEPPSLTDLPQGVRDRFLTDAGRPLGMLYPTGSVFDTEELRTYVDASRRVSPEATGFPVVFRNMTDRITTGFVRAVGCGALFVILILLADYRSPRDAFLAMVPLVMGIVWMVGGMRLLGLSFNFANLIAVPLIIGVGIDNGVHVIHRIRLEGREGMHVVLRHTGRAILIASLTTMIGFGSLSFASHRGMASLGVVLLLGVGSCLVTSTVVLPNLLVVLGLVRR